MDNLMFWKTWPATYRRTGYVFAGVFLVAFIAFWYYHHAGASSVIDWTMQYDQQQISATTNQFDQGLFHFWVPLDAYATFMYYDAGPMQPNVVGSYIFLGLLVASTILLMTVICTLERFWYLFGAALVILFIASLRLNVLHLPGWDHDVPTIGAVALYILLSFYFNTLRPATPFVTRLLAFTLLTGVVAVVVALFSGVAYPFLHLSVTAYGAAMVLTLIFVFTVAHEIFAGLVYITSQGSMKSLRHFMIISGLYLLNLIVTYLHEMGFIEWQIFIGIYPLLTISTLLGLWGFRKRESLYRNIMVFDPLGAFAFVAMATIAFATLGYLSGTANDPALKIVRQAIIFGNLGYGIIFFTYILSNFVLMMAQNLPVFKVLYKPNRMPYFTFRLAGLIAVLAFVFYADWRQYVYQGISGFYNAIGDLYIQMDQTGIAEAYYERGAVYGISNNHSNYALASIHRAGHEYNKTIDYYADANRLRPTLYSLVDAGNVRIVADKRGAIEQYKGGLKRMPEAGVLQNNLGYALATVRRLDSATLYFDQAADRPLTRHTALFNFIGEMTKETIPLNPDSLLNVYGPDDPAFQANALALAVNVNKEVRTKIDPFPKGPLDLITATRMNNYLVANIEKLDTAFLNRAYKVATDSANADFSEALLSVIAQGYYHQHLVYKAFDIMRGLAYTTSANAAKYNYTMGLWSMEQGDFPLAESSFNKALGNKTYDLSYLYKALALTVQHNYSEAQVAWDSLAKVRRLTDSARIAITRTTLALSLDQVLKHEDEVKYAYCHYHSGPNDTTNYNKVMRSLTADNLKALCLLEISQKEYQLDRIPQAVSYFNRINGLNIQNDALTDKIGHFRFLLLLSQNQLNVADSLIRSGLVFPVEFMPEKVLYDAMMSEARGDTLKARPLYDWLASSNPYFEEGVIQAARFYEFTKSNTLHAYAILADAVQRNNSSVRLLHAYVDEASRMGLEEYQASAMDRIRRLEEQ